jgi:hypothetical protein
MRYELLLLFLIPMFALCGSRPTTNNANDVGVVIREYDVPTPNSRPHDPAVAPQTNATDCEAGAFSVFTMHA